MVMNIFSSDARVTKNKKACRIINRRKRKSRLYFIMSCTFDNKRYSICDIYLLHFEPFQ